MMMVMTPTQKIWHDAGIQDGLNGAPVVGNAHWYLVGYAEGERRRRTQ